jgi:predicted alpha-1,2-mannosidase
MVSNLNEFRICGTASRKTMLRRVMALGAVTLIALSTSVRAQRPSSLVDPLIGTANDGNTFPGAAMPFGMIQWSPDTGQGFYYYKDPQIHGFSLTHLSGGGCPVFADMPILPWSSRPAEDRSNQPVESVGFQHQEEVSRPGYYSVRLQDGTSIELTVTDRAGLARIRYPAGKHAGLLVNGAGSASADVHMSQLPPVGREMDGESLTLQPDGTLTGTVTSGGFCGTPTRYTLHVALQMSQKPAKTELWRNSKLQEGSTHVEGKKAAAWLDFGEDSEVLVKVGLSYVSEANAQDNLKSEVPGWDFDKMRLQAEAEWDRTLGLIEVEGGTPAERTSFYTGLYHMLLAPNLFSDLNGEYQGFDGKTHKLPAGQKQQFANFSDWDIYRNVVQLQAWLFPKRASDMAQSLVNDAEQMGSFPRWAIANDSSYVMGGDSPPLVITGWNAFGANHFDRQEALGWMKRGALAPGLGIHGMLERPHLSDYLRLGYSPVTADSPLGDISVSETLEYANADFAIARFAQSLGDDKDSSVLLQHSTGWKKLMDPSTRWLRPRAADGSWLKGFDAERSLPHRSNAPVPTDQYGYEEGNAYQYTFMVPFDYQGLFELMGSSALVEQRLDKFFAKLVCWGEPCFNMANEPDFVTPYAYTFLGKPWKTAEVITRIENETFNTTHAGLPGNDDLGATSGVYVWNMLGLYPVIPGVGGLVIGTPRFASSTMHLGTGQTLHIERSGEGIYVQGVRLNNKDWTSSWLPLNALKPGVNSLRFSMSTKPESHWATEKVDLPPSSSTELAK